MSRTKINTTSDIGSIIKEARLYKNMTLLAVATKAGFTYMTIHNIENNIGSTRTETLIAVASVVGVHIEMVADYNLTKTERIAAAMGVRK